MKRNHLFKAIISLIMLFGFNLYALPKPALIQPDDKDSCTSRYYQFAWQQELEIVDYELQISGNPYFTSYETHIPSTTETSAWVLLPQYNTSYWWRVFVRYQDGTGDTSATFTFKTKYPEPTLVSPENNATCQKQRITFQWNRPENTRRYRIEVSDTVNFDRILFSRTVQDTNIATFTMGNYLTHYYWRVRANIRQNCTSDWSEVFTFRTAPSPAVIDYPLNNAKGINSFDTLKWHTELIADSFRVVISKNADLSEPIIDTNGIILNKFPFENFDLNTKYYWQVQATIWDCLTELSPIYSFNTLYEAPQTIAPVNNATCVSLFADIIWNQVPNTSAYTLLVSKHADMSDTFALKKNINDTTTVITLDNGKAVYYWTVKAEDNNNYGLWSEVNSFTTTYYMPTLATPANNSVGQNMNLNITWNSNYTGIEYAVEVYYVENNNTVILISDTIDTKTLNITLPNYFTNYYWRVRVIGDDCVGQWSEPYIFRTKIKGPELVYPADNAVNVPYYLEFECENIIGADTYDFQISKDSLFTQDSIAFSRYNLAVNKLLCTILKPTTLYYWRARAKNVEGVTEWSNFFKFTTVIQGPDIPTLVYPANSAKTIPVNLEFKWVESPRADKYRLLISEKFDFSKIFKDTTGIDTNVCIVDGLKNYTNYYWKVLAINDSGATKYSTAWTFRTVSLPPANAPVLTSPAKGDTGLVLVPTFKWNAVKYAEKYILQIATNSDFNSESIVINNANVTGDIRGENVAKYSTEFFWRMKAINDGGETDWSEVFNFTTMINTVGVAEELYFKDLTISPNPAVNNISISFNSIKTNTAEIVIYSLTGQQVLTLSNTSIDTGINTFNINISNLETGMYYMQISTDNISTTRAFSIVK